MFSTVQATLKGFLRRAAVIARFFILLKANRVIALNHRQSSFVSRALQ